MALREILVELGIEVDDDNAEKTIDNIRKGLRRMGDEGDKASKKASKGIKGFIKRMSGLQKTVIAAGAAFITGKLAQGLFSFVDAASDAAEITNKLGAVFNEQTPAAEEFGQELATRIGQSRIQIQQMTADVGALVKPLVGTEEAALDMAKAVTELSFDISSFENVSPEDAINAMRSALIGSSEPMLRFGVDTRAAALDQFRLAQGIKKSIKEMSNAEITALRLALIQERLGEKGAVGDATKTAGGFANRLRALQGAFKDLKAEVGKEFLPVALELVNVLVDFVKTAGPGLAKFARIMVFALRAVGRIIKFVSNIIVGFAKALTSAEGVIIILIAAVTGLTIAFKTVGAAAVFSAVKAAAAWVVATAPLLLMILLLGLIVAAILLVVEDLFAMGEGAESVSGTMIQGFLDLVDELGSIPAAIAEMLKVALAFWLEFFGMAKDEAELFAEALFETLSNAWTNVVEFWKGVWSDYVKWVQETTMSVINWFRETFVEFDTWIRGLIRGVIGEEIDWVRDKIAGLLGWLIEKFGKAANFFRGIFGDETQTGGVRQTAAAVAPAVSKIASPGGNIAGVSPTAVTAPGGGRTLINQPRTNVSIDVNASGTNATASDIGNAVAREVDAAMERRDRQTMQAFATQAEAS